MKYLSICKRERERHGFHYTYNLIQLFLCKVIRAHIYRWNVHALSSQRVNETDTSPLQS